MCACGECDGQSEKRVSRSTAFWIRSILVLVSPAMPTNTSIQPVDIEEIRNILQQVLHIRCVFPCTDESQVFDLHRSQISTRCMLEKKDVDKAKALKDGLDDIMVRMRAFDDDADMKRVTLKVSAAFC